MNLWLLITEFGNEKLYFALIPFIYFIVDRKMGWRLFLALLLSSLAVVALKNFLKLPRPPKNLWKTSAEGYGFPSGHTAISTTFWSFLALRRKIFAIGLILAVLIGISRVMLEVHYVRDVVGGFLIGMLIGALAYYIDVTIPAIMFAISLYPIIGVTSLKIGGYILGFGIAHRISVERFEAPESIKLRLILSFISLAILPLGFYYPLMSPIAGFLGCFVPNYIGEALR